MDGTEVIDLIDRQEWVEPTADVLSGVVQTSFDSLGELSQPVRNFLHGAWFGHPLHPALTDVPVGAWTVAAVLDTAELFGVESAASGADAAIAIGLAGAAASAVTGFADWHVLEDGSKPKKVGAVHAVLNISATVLYGASLLFRKSQHRGLGRFFSGIGYGLVAASAYLGGILVVEQKIGVDHAPREGFPDGWTATLEEAELEEKKPKCAKAGDIEIVLVRLDGKVRALANSCSHQGGPLCEGEIKDSGIVCPWHGSRFDLVSGVVLDGPASIRQPAFETRVRDGKIEVRVSTSQPLAATSDQ